MSLLVAFVLVFVVALLFWMLFRNAGALRSRWVISKLFRLSAVIAAGIGVGLVAPRARPAPRQRHHPRRDEPPCRAASDPACKPLQRG